MEWFEAVEVFRERVVQISTPRGSGTGFLISSPAQAGLWAIATAAHVVNDSHWWEEPIRLHHPASGKTQILRQNDRAVVFRHELDTAAIVFGATDLPLPANTIRMIPDGNHLKVGNEIGWLGFPSVSPSEMCFFGGRVSAWIERQRTYLVDGVAINGVSGGPALYITLDNKLVLIGVVSAYLPNRALGESLPGLSMVRDITQFQELIRDFKSMEEAAAKGAEEPAQPPTPEPENTKLKM